MSTNRIGGDFDADSIEVFRAAYAAQYLTPQDQDVHELSGLPTNTISNTSPWIESTGLWKYPSGKGPEEDLKAPFNPTDFYSDVDLDEDSEEEEISLEDVSEEDLKAYFDSLNEEEFEALGAELGLVEDDYDDEDDQDPPFTDEEIDNLIAEMLSDLDEDEELEEI